MCFSCDFDKVLAWCVRAREGSYWMGAKVVGPGPLGVGEWRVAIPYHTCRMSVSCEAVCALPMFCIRNTYY